MSNLKVKLNLFEKRLAFQVIAQSEDITGTLSNPKKFVASNGFEIISSQHPGFSVDSSKSINLRGEETERDLDVAVASFSSNEDALSFYYLAKVALNEFVDSLRVEEVNKLLETQGVIDLGNCELLVRYIKNGFVIQLLSSCIQKEAPNVHNSDQFGIRVELNGDVQIYLPFHTIDPQQVIVLTDKVQAKTGMASEDIVKNILYSLLLLKDNNSGDGYFELLIDY